MISIITAERVNSAILEEKPELADHLRQFAPTVANTVSEPSADWKSRYGLAFHCWASPRRFTPAAHCEQRPANFKFRCRTIAALRKKPSRRLPTAFIRCETSLPRIFFRAIPERNLYFNTLKQRRSCSKHSVWPVKIPRLNPDLRSPKPRINCVIDANAAKQFLFSFK